MDKPEKLPLSGTREYWLRRAAAARTLADLADEAGSRALARGIADSYALLAAHTAPDGPEVRLARALEEAEARVTLGARHIAHQRALIARLQAENAASDIAANLLRLFEEMQALHCEHRDRLARDLAKHPR